MRGTGRALVVAKAPVPGRVKTRLAATVGTDLAARLAAAALLDTLAACAAAFEECHLALDGDLADGVDGAALAAATRGWHVFGQSAGDLGDRLAAAHHEVARTGAGPVVQVGMDTPQLVPGTLRAIAAAAAGRTAVLGPALDGGWWVLALGTSGPADALAGVPMSTPSTYAATRTALQQAGMTVRATVRLQDVDEVAAAASVAAAAPGTRFAAAWRSARGAA